MATLLVAEWLSLTKDDISLTLYVRKFANLPPSIHVMCAVMLWKLG